MKKTVFFFVILLLALATLPVFGACASNDEPIRIHIRANSDGDRDQAVKYVVRNAVVSDLTDAMRSARNRSDAYRRIENRLSGIEKTARSTLAHCGFVYGAKAKMSREYFPDRRYGDVFYPAGMYDALIVELGSGTGGNWWCVAYPPLCFYGDDEEEFRYSSLIAEWMGL